MKKYLIEVISGPAGPSIYVNDYRVAGPKPWGGGDLLHKFIVEEDDLESGMEHSFPARSQ